MARIIRAKYEKGVLKPLEELDLEEGEEVIVRIEESIDGLAKRYRGCLGKASARELEELEEEAQYQ